VLQSRCCNHGRACSRYMRSRETTRKQYFRSRSFGSSASAFTVLVCRLTVFWGVFCLAVLSCATQTRLLKTDKQFTSLQYYSTQ